LPNVKTRSVEINISPKSPTIIGPSLKSRKTNQQIVLLKLQLYEAFSQFIRKLKGGEAHQLPHKHM